MIQRIRIIARKKPNPQILSKTSLPKYILLFAQNKSDNHSPKKFNSVKSIKMPKNSKKSSTLSKSRVRFDPVLDPETSPINNSGSGTYPNSSNSPNNSLLDNSHNETFERKLNDLVGKVLSRPLLAVLTGKDAILKEVRDSTLRYYEAQLKKTSPYNHSLYRNLSVKSGCICVDERIAVPKSTKDAVLEDLHTPHPGCWVPDMSCQGEENWPPSETTSWHNLRERERSASSLTFLGRGMPPKALKYTTASIVTDVLYQ